MIYSNDNDSCKELQVSTKTFYYFLFFIIQDLCDIIKTKHLHCRQTDVYKWFIQGRERSSDKINFCDWLHWWFKVIAYVCKEHHIKTHLSPEVQCKVCSLWICAWLSGKHSEHTYGTERCLLYLWMKLLTSHLPPLTFHLRLFLPVILS